MKEYKKSSRIRNDDWAEFRREHQALYDFYYGLDYNQRFNNDETEQKVHQCSQSGKEESNQDETSGSSRRDCDNSETQAKD